MNLNSKWMSTWLPCALLATPALAQEPVKGLSVHDSEDSKPKELNYQTNGIAGNPNIVVILTDDVGFAQMGATGGQIKTPAFDRIAEDGLLYNRFHTTALSSPTRAALLTGRNHHHAETGVIMELGNGNEGYTSMLPDETASFAKVMQDAGYSTSWFGKNHNVPAWEATITGPFNRWPNELGFDYFYGFLGGDTDQFHPALVENRTRIEAPSTNADGSPYHLTHDMADKAISYIESVDALAPDKPFLLYFSPGAVHAPHQAPKEYIEKYKGQFDEGWDVFREKAFANMKVKGIIPENAELTPRPANLPAWDSLTDEQRMVFANMMEVFAGFTEHTDDQINRVYDAVEEMGKLDNTVFIYMAGDNGASAEGGMDGLLNEMALFNGIEEPWEDKVAAVKSGTLGSELYFNHMPAAWAWAVNSPYQWTKQVSSHLGGVRNAMAISYPNGIKEKGGIRSQFTHVTDIAPTILEIAGLEMPKSIDGVDQDPFDGTSFVSSFEDEHAEEKHTTQYFEILGNLGIYHDGWWAGAMRVEPWEAASTKIDLMDMEWELYNLEEDFSQAHNLAAEMPKKLEYMKHMFFAEAAKNKALPIDDRRAERLRSTNRPSLASGRTTFKYPNGLRIPEGGTPFIKFISHQFTAKLDEGYKRGDKGVLITQGGRFAGFSLFVDKSGYLVYVYNDTTKPYIIKSKTKVSAGAKEMQAKVIMDEMKPYTPATIQLMVDGKIVGEGRIGRTIPNIYSLDETLDVGHDTGTSVCDLYKVKDSKYTGLLKRVTIDLIEEYSVK